MSLVVLMVGKTMILFFLTMICFRIMGYRTLGDMEPMDYVIVLGISEIMGSPLSTPERNIWYSVVTILSLTLIQIGLSVLYTKYPKLNRMMEGGPVPVIRNGRILYRNLEKNRVDINTVREELRVKGIRSEKDVDTAYLEPSGRFSVILKNEVSPITPRYFGEKGSFLLVEKGEVRKDDWEESGVSQEDVLAFLREEQVDDWKEIDNLFYKNGAFILEKKKDEKN